jgi:dihydrofolate reductase
MQNVRVCNFSVSLDGYGAGPDQSLEQPLGTNGLALHQWSFATKSFQEVAGISPNTGQTGVDDDFVARGFRNIGAYVLGRHMFSPSRGPWTDHEWKGWWGPNPPFHAPVFVLTHHIRPSFALEGGTVFHFVTEGMVSALDQARRAAGPKDVCIGGGVATIRDYLKLGVIDELHVVIAPVLLGSGEHFWQGLDLVKLGYRCTEYVASPSAIHVVLKK